MSELFTLTMSPLELVVRGSLVYLGLILVVRFILRRDIGTLGTADLLFIVLVADASQNAMAGEYKSVADGAVLLGTLICWNIALDALAYRFPVLRRLVEAPPLPLIRDGRIQRRNLKKEWITLEELQGKLREHGVDDLGEVRLATLEMDGELSVLRRYSTEDESQGKRRSATIG